jgi:hypothetical protein
LATFGEVVAKIREDLNRGSDADSRIKRAIADAIYFYRAKRVGFNIKRAYAVVTSGNEYVSLPTDWIEADFLQLQDGTRREKLEEVTYDWIEDQHVDENERGEPYKYAIQHRTLRLYPSPDRSYTLMFSFHYELKDVSVSASDGATNAWLTEGEQLIRKHAMAEMYVNYIGGAEAVAMGQLLYDECSKTYLPALESQAAREQSSGRVKPFL